MLHYLFQVILQAYLRRRENKIFLSTISEKAEHLQAASWADYWILLHANTEMHVQRSLCKAVIPASWLLLGSSIEYKVQIAHHSSCWSYSIGMSLQPLLCSALKRKTSRTQTHCTLIGSTYQYGKVWYGMVWYICHMVWYMCLLTAGRSCHRSC